MVAICEFKDLYFKVGMRCKRGSFVGIVQSRRHSLHRRFTHC